MLPLLRRRYLERLKSELGGRSVPGIPQAAFDEGRGWPRPFSDGVFTMIGQRRLDNVQLCVEQVLRRRVPGDLIEAGVWRGGTAILMRGILAAHGVRNRTVYLADSFEGVPPPQPDVYPRDEDFTLHLDADLAVSAGEVRANFSHFGLLDDHLRFIEGWFRDTLPGLRGHQWAVVRLDGDLYESTMDGLTNLYDGLSPGGFLIVDDYSVYPACAAAVDDFRDQRRIRDPLVRIDFDGVYWQRTEGERE